MVRWLARLAAVLALAWGAGLAWFVGVVPPPAPANVHTDAIVVLTGGEERVPRGLAMLRSGAAPRLLISGVAAGVGSRQLAREVETPLALFRCCVDLGHQAVDTRSNAEETAAWVTAHHVRSLRLVTSSYHMRRAALELAAELGPGVRIVRDAVPDRVSARAYMREYSKWLVRLLARRAEAV